jgi:hypothetical protein
MRHDFIRPTCTPSHNILSLCTPFTQHPPKVDISAQYLSTLYPIIQRPITLDSYLSTQNPPTLYPSTQSLATSSTYSLTHTIHPYVLYVLKHNISTSSLNTSTFNVLAQYINRSSQTISLYIFQPMYVPISAQTIYLDPAKLYS